MSGRRFRRRRSCGAWPRRRSRCARGPLRRRRPRLEHSAPRRRRPRPVRARLSVPRPGAGRGGRATGRHRRPVGAPARAALLAFAGATVALLAAAVPARHGLATGLLGAAAAARRCSSSSRRSRGGAARPEDNGRVRRDELWRDDAPLSYEAIATRHWRQATPRSNGISRSRCSAVWGVNRPLRCGRPPRAASREMHRTRRRVSPLYRDAGAYRPCSPAIRRALDEAQDPIARSRLLRSVRRIRSVAFADYRDEYPSATAPATLATSRRCRGWRRSAQAE